ncbi:arabinosyltransferase XEG113-like [Coffea eugenioides]|uniref:arabinosyltransferase XEG113-like n=1 Tax=Coffea eugenioides TaxID=49369 RepID=UPI000F613681|nr:arabinosyltransferase XEG113-like [Coffea eugenioides]
MQSSDRSLADMQSDMLLEMFASFTMIEIIMSISAVCKCWKSLSSELTMWKTLDLTMFRDYFRSQHLGRAGCTKSCRLLVPVPPSETPFSSIFTVINRPRSKDYRQLLNCGEHSASIFQIIGQNCKILTVLRLRVCDLVNQISSTITNCLPGLKVFVLRCDAIEKDALKNLLDGLANLDELYISISATALATDPFGLSEILAPFQDESIVQKASMLRRNNPLKNMADCKAIFLPIYAIVVIGASLYCLFIFSDVYRSCSSSSSFSLLSSSPGQSQASNSSHRTNSGNPSLAPISRMENKLVKPIWAVPPAGSQKMPPRKAFKLSKKLVQQRVKDNIIIVTFGNYAFMDFILNWVKHLTELSIENLLVGAMDTKLLEALYWKGVPVFDMGRQTSTIDVGWGSPDFQKMQREKAILIDAFLPFGFELLLCDSDTVWLKNPLPYLARFPDADILTSTDQLIPTVVDDSLDFCEQIQFAYNVGLFHWRPSNSSKKFAKEWIKLLLADEGLWDQQGFNDIIRRQLGPSVDQDSKLTYAYDGELKLGCLPVSIFGGGHTFFVQKMYQHLGLDPYAAHATFQTSTEAKRHRFREANLLFDPPSYYDVPGGFLTFKPSIPKNLLLDGEHNIQSHFSLVNYQIKQIRTAFAVASLLNRTLVMPRLWCRMDSVFFAHPRDLTGSIMRQPFICPLDYVFQVNIMVKELPENKFGPSIRFREHSLFDNPSMPQKVKDSWLDVDLCQEWSQGCQVSSNTTRSQTGVLKFPKNSSEQTYTAVFSSFKTVKVIQFSSMRDAFAGFADKLKEEKFRNRMKAYMGRWCCVEDHDPPHIYYDIYWDEKPDWKPEPPQTPEDDHPPS